MKDINSEEGRKEFLKDKTIGFLCCFCGLSEGEPDVTITIHKNSQHFWAHKKCLVKRLCKMAKENLA